MAQEHIIDHAEFDIRFADEQTAQQQQALLADFIKDELLVVVEEVFDEVSGPGEVLRIENLALDLGDFSSLEYRREMGHSLKQQLREMLHAQRSAVAVMPVRGTELLATTHSDIEVLEYFLLHGYLPWHVSHQQQQSFMEGWTVIGAQQLNSICQLLRQHRAHPVVLERAVKQLPPSLFPRLAQLCLKDQTDGARFNSLLELMLEAMGALTGLTPSQTRAWLALFRHLLNPQADSLSRCNELFFLLAEQSGISEKKLAPLNTPFVDASARQAEQKKQRNLTKNLRQHFALLSDGILRGKADALRENWRMMLAEYGPLIEMLLRQHGMDGDVRRRIAYGFDEQMLHDIVHILEPNESDFISDLMSRPALFYLPQQPPPQGESKLKCQLWSYTLGYLLVERGSEFNKRSYLSSVLVQLAARENVSVWMLLDSMQALLTQVAIASQLRHEMCSLLAALREQWAEPAVLGSQVSFEAKQSQQSERAAATAPLQQWLMGLLAGKQSEGIPAPADLSAALPERILAQLKSCLSDDEMSANIVAGLNEKQRLSLSQQLHPEATASIRLLIDQASVLQEVLSLPCSSQQLHDDIWRFSMMYFAKAAVAGFKQHNYFQAMLSHLAKRYQLSLTAWQADASGLVDHVQTPTLAAPLYSAISAIANGDSLATARDEKIALNTFDEQLRALLEGATSLSLDLIWPRWRQQDAQALQRALLRLGREARIRRAIVQQASEATLLDLVEFLEPTHKVFVGEVVSQFSNYQPDRGDAPVAQPVLRSTLWEFTLAYLLVDRGSQFNRKSYLASMIKRLAAHHNQTEQELLQGLFALVQQLVPGSAESGALVDLIRELAAPYQRDGFNHARSDSCNDAWDIPLSDQQLRTCLAVDALNQSALIMQYFKTLQQQAPWCLMALFREWHVATATRDGVMQLPEQALAQLLAIWFDVTQQSSGGASGSELLRAITLYADRTEQRHHYYQLVLRCLFEQRLIDFDLIMEQLSKEQSAEFKHIQPLQTAPNIDDDRDVNAKHRAGQIEQGSAVDQRYSLLLKRFIQQPQFAWPAADLEAALEWLLNQDSEKFPAQFKLGMENSAVSERLVGLMSETLLLRLLRHLHPFIDQDLWRLFSVMGNAVAQLALPALPPSLAWRYLFHYLFVEGQLFDESRFVSGYVSFLSGEIDRPQREVWCSQFCLQLVKDSLPSTQDLVQRVVKQLADAPEVDRQTSLSDAVAAVATDSSYGSAPDQQPEQDEPDEEIYITNAGLVLLSPYIPRLFEMLGLLKQGRLNERSDAERAVHLLQYLAAQSCSGAEYQLVLNKLLCGVRSGQPIVREIEISEQEQQAIESLLYGVVQNWSALGNTSPEGLRESFLMRDGCLQRKDDAWHLTVEKRAYDVLLDQLPWSYSPVKHPWMERVIYVEWR